VAHIEWTVTCTAEFDPMRFDASDPADYVSALREELSGAKIEWADWQGLTFFTCVSTYTTCEAFVEIIGADTNYPIVPIVGA
jgi:hypothetical protein